MFFSDICSPFTSSLKVQSRATRAITSRAGVINTASASGERILIAPGAIASIVSLEANSYVPAPASEVVFVEADALWEAEALSVDAFFVSPGVNDLLSPAVGKVTAVGVPGLVSLVSLGHEGLPVSTSTKLCLGMSRPP